MTSPNTNCKTVEEKKQELREMYLYGQLTFEEYIDFSLRADIEFGLNKLEQADVYFEQLAF